jgi:hypothetical protein
MKNAAQKKLLPLAQRAARVLARLKGVKGLDEAEKSVHALGLAATPHERWLMFEESLRSYGYWKPSKRKRLTTQ